MRVQRFYARPCQHASSGAPIWGFTVAMLIQGRDWRGRDGTRDWDRKLRGSEPDPRLSNKSTTAKLVCKMVQAGWCRCQVENALTDDAHVGGLYFRWRQTTDNDPDSYLAHLLEGSYSTEQTRAWQQDQRQRGLAAGVDKRYLPKAEDVDIHLGNTVTGGYRITKVKPENIWRTSPDGFSFSLDRSRALLHLVQRTGAINGSQLRQSGVINPRSVRTYAAELVRVGLLTKTREKIRCANGKQQPCDVYRLATDIPRLVDATDKPLWDVLRRFEPRPADSWTLDAFGLA